MGLEDGQIDVMALGAGLAGGVAGAYYRPFGSSIVGFLAGSTAASLAVGLSRMAAQQLMPAQEVVVWDMGMASTAADTRMPPPTGG